MSNYMPKEYAAGVYDDPNHLDGTCFKITTWNVNGLNACMDKGFRDYVRAENADIARSRARLGERTAIEESSEVTRSTASPTAFSMVPKSPRRPSSRLPCPRKSSA